jgi:hypothetical protein
MCGMCAHVDLVFAEFGTYFMQIDQKGRLYSATQSGAFVSEDNGVTWNAYHVKIAMRSGQEMDRVPHDYQNIVPNFRGDGIAFPSDQGTWVISAFFCTCVTVVNPFSEVQDVLIVSLLWTTRVRHV